MKRAKKTTMCLQRATKGRGFVSPEYAVGAKRFMVIAGGLYLSIVEGVSHVSIHQREILVEQFEHFYKGNNRLIIVFRHAAKEDAPVMMYALHRHVQKLLNKRKKKHHAQRCVAHAHFLYGKDVLNWAGKASAWLFPKIGCIPVQNRSSNRTGLHVLRTQVREGLFPIALAPEEQVTYHMYHCSEIAPGVSALASWAREGGQDVTIVPISLGYRHSKNPDILIRKILQKWETLTGIILVDREHRPILSLLEEVTSHTVTILEEFYQCSSTIDASLQDRLQEVCEHAMRTAEYFAQKKGTGTILDRLFHIRYRGVDSIHPEQYDPHRLPPLGHSVADFRALQAHLYLRHTQVVDVLQYIHPSYIQSPCHTGRAVEYALNLLDVINRMQGGTINTRFSPKKKQAMVHVGTPINLCASHQQQKKSRKEELHYITETVYEALQFTSEKMESFWENSSFIE